MIVARRWPWFAAWLARHSQARLRKRFDSIHIRGLDRLADVSKTQPVLFVANHVCWWDGLVILYLSVHLLKQDAYAMMLAKNLAERFFFARAGGFGVDTDRAGDGAAGIRHAASLLDRPGRAVWIFPQGREQPQDKRPLGFARGAGVVHRLAPEARVVPVGIVYRFGGHERPELWVSFGTSRGTSTRQLEADVTHELDRIAEVVAGPEPTPEPTQETTPVHGQFECVYKRTEPWWSRAAEACLSACTRLGFKPSVRALPAAKPK